MYGILESYAIGELAKIGWMPGGTNPDDALTKAAWRKSSPLLSLIQNNKLYLHPVGWPSGKQASKTPPPRNAPEESDNKLTKSNDALDISRPKIIQSAHQPKVSRGDESRRNDDAKEKWQNS